MVNACEEADESSIADAEEDGAALVGDLAWRRTSEAVLSFSSSESVTFSSESATVSSKATFSRRARRLGVSASSLWANSFLTESSAGFCDPPK